MIKMTLKLLIKESYLLGKVFGYVMVIMEDYFSGQGMPLWSNKSSIGFHKTETLNAHNFLISGWIRKIQSSPQSLFGVHKKYSTQLGSGGKIRVGRVRLNKVFFILGLII